MNRDRPKLKLFTESIALTLKIKFINHKLYYYKNIFHNHYIIKEKPEVFNKSIIILCYYFKNLISYFKNILIGTQSKHRLSDQDVHYIIYGTSFQLTNNNCN